VQNATVLDVGIWEEPIEFVPTPVPEETTEEPTPVPQGPTVAQAARQLISVTLIVSPQDALVLKWALETNASINLAMRSAIDQDIYSQPEAVTLQYMIDRFQIAVPPRLPYAAENRFSVTILQEGQQTAPAAGE
jgi:hypothetical protein